MRVVHTSMFNSNSASASLSRYAGDVFRALEESMDCNVCSSCSFKHCALAMCSRRETYKSSESVTDWGTIGYSQHLACRLLKMPYR